MIHVMPAHTRRTDRNCLGARTLRVECTLRGLIPSQPEVPTRRPRLPVQEEEELSSPRDDESVARFRSEAALLPLAAAAFAADVEWTVVRSSRPQTSEEAAVESWSSSCLQACD